MSKPVTFELNLEMHVYPVLHLARMAVAMEHMLAEIDAVRDMLPDFHERLKSLGLCTCYGEPVADYVDAALLGASDLLQAHQAGPFFVVDRKDGGPA
jgi:hypothetical protein